MVSANLLIDGGLALYLLLGSASWGYIMLRMGWPNIRSLEIEYKSGWSIIFGIIFSALILVMSLVGSVTQFTGMTLTELLFINTIIVSFVGIIIVTIKRKFIGGKKVKIGIPKRVVTANVVAQKAFAKIPEKNYIKTSEMKKQKIAKLKDRIDHKTATGEGAATDRSTREGAGEIKPVGEIFRKAETGAVTKTEIKPIAKPEGQTLEEKAFAKEEIKPIVKPKEKKSLIQLTREIPKPIFKDKRKGFVKATPETKEKNVGKIIDILEKKETERHETKIVTREEMNKKLEDQKKYIKDNLREKIGPIKQKEQELTQEKQAQELAKKTQEQKQMEEENEKIEKALPKSAKLLKELLKEDEGNNE